LEPFAAWSMGCCNRTPSGGVHVWIRLIGNDRVPGNTKVAMGPDNECLIETRGEGGYAIAAPANGPTHETGRPWTQFHGGCESIEWVPPELYYPVLDVMASFDRSPAQPPPPPIRPRFTGNGWINDVLAKMDLANELTAVGATYVRSDDRGQLWRRDGKNHGVSFRINSSGRLHVFSSSTPLPVSTNPPHPTYDALDVRLAYQYGRPPTLDERTEACRPMRTDVGMPARTPAQLPEAGGQQEAAPAEVSLHRPDEFWQARPYLAHIYTAALAMQISPDAVWENEFCNYMACIPSTFLLPEMGTLDWISVIAGGSSAGKSKAQDVGLWLMPTEVMGPNDTCILGGTRLSMPEGSGEGLIEAYIVRDSKGRQIAGQYQFNRIGFYTDEGSFLNEINARQGNTTFSIMRSLWSGKSTGQTNASAAKRRYIPARAVRYTHSISVTPEAATRFLDPALTDAGFPQRLGWSWAKHPILATDYEIPEWPGPLQIPMHLDNQIGCTMQIDPGIEKIRRQARMAAHTEMAVRGVALDGHLHLTTRKRAAGLALMDDRTHITMEDFELALLDAEISRNVRAHLQARRAAVVEERSRLAGRNDAIRETEKYRYWLNQGVETLERLVLSSDEPIPTKRAQSAVSHFRRRYGVRYSAIVDEAIARRAVRRIDGVGLARPVGA
jgi:hypothetical protein